jgi:hypothetical protein
MNTAQLKTNHRVTLVLDIDGVVLDSNRGGLGSWKNELRRRFGVDADALTEVFFCASLARHRDRSPRP